MILVGLHYVLKLLLKTQIARTIKCIKWLEWLVQKLCLMMRMYKQQLLFHELRGRFKEVTAFEYLRVLSRKDAILIIRK